MTHVEPVSQAEISKKADTAEEKLCRRMKITKSNRFNYSRRLNGRVRNLSFSLHTLSFLSILLGVYLLAFAVNLTPEGAQLIGTLSIGISVISIVVSQISPAEVDSRKANDAHKCAREISTLYRQLESGSIRLADASKAYEDIVSTYTDNHDNCDFMLTLCSYKEEMKNLKEEHGANLFNGSLKSYLSMKGPFIFTCAGVIITASVFRKRCRRPTLPTGSAIAS
ncbi:SLATT domain-containing protein [Salipiger mangrovisoli]|nr:SLATT domain-containing protein [Salipiger mangrovisoli]